MRINHWLIIFAVFLIACSDENADNSATSSDQTTPKKEIEFEKIEIKKTPLFDPRIAYDYIQKQVEFGPRVPNTESHKKCAEYLANELSDLGLDTIVQRTTVQAFNGKMLSIYNIVGQFNPEAKDRILLCAHWDSRPFADRDTKKQAKPIDAANDGASGVGVLLEIARSISKSDVKPNIGYDIIFFDAEDYGQPNNTMISQQGNTWCLGSQYWAQNKHRQGYTAKYGILLDMVGAKDAVFPKDGVSMQYAPLQTNKMWKIAAKLGYGDLFVQDRMMGQITDDHLYINAWAGIPCLDVIHYDVQARDFGPFHHRHTDNMEIIDTNTLKAVGETVLQMIYQES